MSENHRWLLFKRIWNSRTVLEQFGIFFFLVYAISRKNCSPHFDCGILFLLCLSFLFLKHDFFFLRTQFLFRNQSNFTKSFFVIISHIMKKKRYALLCSQFCHHVRLMMYFEMNKNKWIVYKTSRTIFFLIEASMSRNEVFFSSIFLY